MIDEPTTTKTQAQPAPARRGRPVGDREGRRSALLEAAMRVIAEEGFAAASLRRVAQRAGVSTGAVTYSFANKEAMLTAVIESQFDRFDTLLDVELSPQGVRAMFERWLEMCRADEGGEWVSGFQLLAYARHDPVLADIYQRRNARFRAAAAEMLARGQERGWVRTDVPADLLADQLTAMGDGWMILLPIEPERFGPARVSALLDATMALIAPPGTRKAADDSRPRG
ncbi:MAG: TetR/AcrR family transcriptional regulator [Proteobacteria bacterium]|nr:TetR/AcrR family transcriptional regulator [Pseudomonadota bacterium]